MRSYLTQCFIPLLANPSGTTNMTATGVDDDGTTHIADDSAISNGTTGGHSSPLPVPLL